jgi:hypothetical protein
MIEAVFQWGGGGGRYKVHTLTPFTVSLQQSELLWSRTASEKKYSFRMKLYQPLGGGGGDSAF